MKSGLTAKGNQDLVLDFLASQSEPVCALYVKPDYIVVSMVNLLSVSFL